MGHIVAISYVNDPEFPQIPLMLLDRKKIGESLAWVFEVGQAIDDRNIRIVRQGNANIMGKRSDHDAIDHTFEVFCHIEHRLALAKIDVGRRQRQGLPPELTHAHGERCPGTERWFFKKESNVFALQRTPVPDRAFLHVGCTRKNRLDLLRRKVIDREKITPCNAFLH